jgi:hypothetical protein
MSIASDIPKIIPQGLALTGAQTHAIIEIAYLAVAADRTIHPDEEAALRVFARALGRNGSDAEIDGLLANGGGGRDREAADARLRVLATGLTTTASRELAYKAAYAMSLADLAAADEEFEFDLELIDALGLTSEAVDELTAEVVAVLETD